MKKDRSYDTMQSLFKLISFVQDDRSFVIAQQIILYETSLLIASSVPISERRRKRECTIYQPKMHCKR